jgi:WD40 repeat protein
MAFKTFCPACNQKLKIDDGMAGESVRCPTCRHVFAVTALASAGAQTVESATSAALIDVSGSEAVEPGRAAGIATTARGSGKSSHARARSQPSIGRLGRFELKRALGQGAFGTVYLAYDPVLDRAVALKVPKFAPDQERQIERFLREGKSAANLHHPNIVAVFESGRAGDDYYIASEFVSGRTLADAIKDPGGHPDLQQVVAWVRDLARALAYAHDLNIIHRDVKPQNIMLDEQGRPRILDFGLAKRIDEDATMTTEGSLLGTPAYMAPEQARGEVKSVGPHSDQYSLGVVLYELLTGQKPFDGPPHAVLAKVAWEEPRAARSLRTDLPIDLTAVCQKAMEKNPAKRYPTADDFADDLERWRTDRPTAARPITRFERMARWCRKNPVVATAVAVVWLALVAIAAVAALYANRQHHFAVEEAKATQRIAKLAADLSTSLKESNQRLAAQQLERGLSAFERGETGRGLLWTVESWKSAIAAEDSSWQRAARANLAAWSREYPELRAVFSHTRPIIALAISPDGKTVATGSEDHTARLWNLATWAPIGPPLEHDDFVPIVAFSPDGTRLATGTVKAVRFWDAASGRLIDSRPFPQRVSAAAYSPDGTRMIVCGPSVTLLWDLKSGKSLGPLTEKPPGVHAVAFSPDGRLILTGSGNGEARLWNALTREPLGPALRQNGERIFSVAFSPDSKTFLLGVNGRVRLLETATMRPVGRPVLHQGNVRVVGFARDGKTFMTGSIDKTARLWDSATQAPIGPIYRQEGPIEAGALSPDGKTLFTAGGDYTAKAWAISTGSRGPFTIRHQKPGGMVAFCPSERAFLAVSGNTAQLWDIASGQPVGKALTFPRELECVAISPDGKTLLGGSSDRVARLFDLESGKPRGQQLQHEGDVSVVAFSPDGTIILTGGQDETARLWNAATQKPLCEPLRQLGQVDAGAFSPDGKLVAIGTSVSNIHLRVVPSGLPAGPPISHNGAVSGVAFSPDGKFLLVGGEDSTAQLWDLASRTRKIPPLQHRNWIWSVAISPDGKTLATGAGDATARLWDASTGVPIGPPFFHPHAVGAVAFDPADSRVILTGCFDKKARLAFTVPDHPDQAERSALWVEVVTGLSLDSYGSVHVLDNASWLSRRQQLERLGRLPVVEKNQ